MARVKIKVKRQVTLKLTHSEAQFLKAYVGNASGTGLPGDLAQHIYDALDEAGVSDGRGPILAEDTSVRLNTEWKPV